jgi:uncharacterized protein
VALEDAAHGREVSGDPGNAWLIEMPVAEIDAACVRVCQAFREGMRRADSPIRRLVAERCELADVAPEDTVFVDLETTGLGSSPLFLIGTLICENGRLVVRQFFARNYAEERPVVSLFLRLMAGKKLIVSFNGRSFDLPYVRVRAAATGLPFHIDTSHLDLLHVSRRIWGKTMPDCKLQTLERQICGRYRSGDIPGHLIPQAYHDFVRTGNARQMRDCLKHNMLDLVTLVDLATRLPEPA